VDYHLTWDARSLRTSWVVTASSTKPSKIKIALTRTWITCAFGASPFNPFFLKTMHPHIRVGAFPHIPTQADFLRFEHYESDPSESIIGRSQVYIPTWADLFCFESCELVLQESHVNEIECQDGVPGC